MVMVITIIAFRYEKRMYVRLMQFQNTIHENEKTRTK